MRKSNDFNMHVHQHWQRSFTGNTVIVCSIINILDKKDGTPPPETINREQGAVTRGTQLRPPLVVLLVYKQVLCQFNIAIKCGFKAISPQGHALDQYLQLQPRPSLVRQAVLAEAYAKL